MTNGADFIQLARKHLRESYVFGARAPKNNANWRGPWDCAEFASWVVFQKTQRLYGCFDNAGDPASADAYTGYWQRDARAGVVQEISVLEASKKLGALLLRFPASGRIGHIAFVAGKNKTVEAHSSATGVAEKTIFERRWDCGLLIPGVHYDTVQQTPPSSAPIIYRVTTPMMRGAVVKTIQQKLKALRFNPGPIDGVYGAMTAAAVQALQLTHGIVADGEVGSVTAGILGVSLK